MVGADPAAERLLKGHQMTKADFTITRRAGGWAVVRSDGALIALGFETKREAQDWWDREAEIAGL